MSDQVDAEDALAAAAVRHEVHRAVVVALAAFREHVAVVDERARDFAAAMEGAELVGKTLCAVVARLCRVEGYEVLELPLYGPRGSLRTGTEMLGRGGCPPVLPQIEEFLRHVDSLLERTER